MGFLRAVCRLRAHHPVELGDEQCRALLDRDRTDDAGQHLLVGFERAAESIEAAWKYIIIISAGISLALLGTVLFYWCGSFVLGPTYDMTWDMLRAAAPKMNPALAALSYLLVLVGYGTKVGLAPMHTWLPDAHSESPAPISAMLSGALLNSAMLGIVRYLTIADAAQIGPLARTTLVAFGVLSLLVGALFIVRQNGIKRLMAYSSVEHMGVVALGFGFGGPLGIAGALYHMLNHSLNKSLMFFGAGNVMRSYGSKEIRNIRDVWARFRCRARCGLPALPRSPARRRSACSSASLSSCAPALSAATTGPSMSWWCC